MRDRNIHTISSHLSHPKRFIGLTVDEAVVAIIGALFLALSSQKTIVIMIFMSIVYGLRKMKKNRGPRFLIVLIYWHLPHAITRCVLPRLPDSALRFWKN